MTAHRANLREAHAHIGQHGRAMTMEQLGSCPGLDDCLQRIARAAGRLTGRSAPNSQWLLGVGLRTEGWPERTCPTAAQLDQAAGDRPACLWSFDHHALVVNSAAMRSAGISAATPDPPNGRIARDRHGAPTGLMLEAAAKLVWSRVPEPSDHERREQVRAALKDLAAHGFVEIHDLLSPAWLGPVLAELHDAGELNATVWLYPRVEEVRAVHASAPTWQRDHLRLAGAKLFADGTLNSRTAWMLAPYADPIPDLPRGQKMASHQQIHESMMLTRELRIGLAVHAIGDAAVRTVLDVYEQSRSSRRSLVNDPLTPLLRPGLAGDPPSLRIEHAEIIDQADISRFAQLGVVCSVQPCHLLADVEALQRGLPHRLDRVLPLRDLIDAGCRPGELLWFGSDTPIVRPHPHDSIQAAMHRRRVGRPNADAIAPGQAVTEEESWCAFT